MGVVRFDVHRRRCLQRRVFGEFDLVSALATFLFLWFITFARSWVGPILPLYSSRFLRRGGSRYSPCLRLFPVFERRYLYITGNVRSFSSPLVCKRKAVFPRVPTALHASPRCWVQRL